MDNILTGNWLPFLSCTLLLCVLVSTILLFSWARNLLNQEKKNREKSKWLRKNNAKHKNRDKNLKIRHDKLKQERQRLDSFANQLLKREELFTTRLFINSQKESEIKREWEKIKTVRQEILESLEKDASLDTNKARKILLSIIEKEIEPELDRYKEEKIKKTEDDIERIITNIICSSLERYSSSLVFSKTADIVTTVDNRDLISKIIGKEGRNINTFRRVTGTDLIIEEDKEKNNEKKKENWVLQVSSFNSLRREIASQTLMNLISEGRISPALIEKTYQIAKEQINSIIRKTGEMVLKELEITNIHPDLIKHLGELKYRTSYGQNVLEHSLEVAKIAGGIALELGLDVILARRSGLFHDIGKSIQDNYKSSHVHSGISLAKKYGEPEEVINAIASHHKDFAVNNIYSFIVIAADTLSASRPGARGYQFESYIERMNNLEKLVNDFPGVKTSYSFQAGREIWVIANANKLNDQQTWEMSRQIKKKIEENIIIPGEVTIYIVREKRFIRKIRDGSEESELLV